MNISKLIYSLALVALIGGIGLWSMHMGSSPVVAQTLLEGTTISTGGGEVDGGETVTPIPPRDCCAGAFDETSFENCLRNEGWKEIPAMRVGAQYERLCD